MVLFYKAVAAISSIATLAVISFVPVAESSPYTISDDRVRNMDITPVLGRGYSIMTDMYHSTCLLVDETTPPSYNYDYSFYEFTSEKESERSLGGKLKYSFGYWGVKGEVSVEGKSTSKSSSKTHRIVTVMRIERYYSSVREEVSPLSDDAKQLLDSEDYIGFFKACGPNYVRGIRRAQEVTAIFRFQSSSTDVARSFSAAIKVSGWGQSVNASFQSDSKFSEVNSSLYIKIMGFGLGLNEEGSDTLVATSLEEFNNVMKYAFKSFTQSKNSYHIGMVYGIEVVPWVDNSAFQVAAKLQDKNVLIAVPRSMIPFAVGGACKNVNYVKDKFNYCCETSAIYNPSTEEYDESIISTTVPLTTATGTCRPQRVLDKALVKENMTSNGEFVARLDSAMRHKLAQISTMEKCLSAARSMPTKYDEHILLPQATVEFDQSLDLKYTLLHLKKSLDPLEDFGLIKQMARELDEFIEMYYSPCLGALFGMNIGDNADTESRFFVAYPWRTHPECMHISCLVPNMRWDRNAGGCVPSMIMGSTAPDYETAAVSATGGKKCKQDEDSDSNDCKYDTAEMNRFKSDAETCWAASSLSSFTIDYFLNHFCMPTITGEKFVASSSPTAVKLNKTKCTASPAPAPAPTNRRLNKSKLEEEDNAIGVKNLKSKQTFDI